VSSERNEINFGFSVGFCVSGYEPSAYVYER